MPRRIGPVKVRRYSLEFKRKAVTLSQLQGVEVQAVADALEIPPFHAVTLAEGGARRDPARPGLGAGWAEHGNRLRRWAVRVPWS